MTAASFLGCIFPLKFPAFEMGNLFQLFRIRNSCFCRKVTTTGKLPLNVSAGLEQIDTELSAFLNL